MGRRTGEKVGWTVGWLGGFLWVVILSVIFLIQRKLFAGAIGLALFFAAVAVIVAGAPWRRPRTPYWKLMVPVYLVFFASIGWMVRASGGPESLGFNWWQSFLLLPLLMPLATAGRRRWADSAVEPPSTSESQQDRQ